MNSLYRQTPFPIENHINSFCGMLQDKFMVHRESAALNLIAIVEGLLGPYPDPNFEHLSPLTQYRLIDSAIAGVESHYGSADFKVQSLKAHVEKTEPKSLPPYGGFFVVKQVPGPLSDRKLIERNFSSIVVVPSEQDFPLAESFRKDNIKGIAFLYVCQDPNREATRLRRHYRDVALILSL
ncbi:MAG TPA: hypothetical protein VJB12_00825 [Candidatus Nanoarchaeia archaeon]|nr:hypothetical protein [Candidatus Nanoarchaeia archaeon]